MQNTIQLPFPAADPFLLPARDGRYYLFYSADWKENPTGALENFRIGAAVADSPAGPFTDLSDRPIFDPGYPVIDANLYAEDGAYYLYYSRCCYEHSVDGLEESWIYGVRLRPDFDLSGFFDASGSLSYGGMADGTLATLCDRAVENIGNVYELHSEIMSRGMLCPILCKTYAIYSGRGRVTNLNPCLDGVFTLPYGE